MAAMGDGLVQRLQAGQRVGTLRRGLREVFVQPPMRLAPRLGPLVLELTAEVVPQQRVGVEGEVGRVKGGR